MSRNVTDLTSWECLLGANEAGLFPVWYIGAIDMKYEPNDDILTIERWKELTDLLEKIE